MDNHLATKKIAPLLFELSLPAVLSMLAGAVYNIVDRIFVGRLDPLAMTGVGVTMPIQILQMAFVLLIGVGAATTISIKLGEGKQQDAEGVLYVACKYSIILMLGFSVLALLFLKPLFSMLYISPAATPYAQDYIVVLLIGSIIGLPGYCINPILRAIGKAKISMRIIIISSVLNIILDPIFIFTFKMGIAGAALATILAQSYVTVAIFRIFLTEKELPIRLKKSCKKDERNYIPLIIKNGSPSFLLQIFSTVITTLTNRAVMAIGADAALANITIMSSIISFYQMIINGISQGNQPICGFNLGAKQYGRVRASLQLSLIVSGMVSAVFYLFIMGFPNQLIAIFTDDAALLASGAAALPVYLSMLPAAGFSIIISQYFQTVSKPKIATALLFLRHGTVYLPAIYLFSYFLQLGILGIYLSNAVSEAIACTVAFFFILREFKALRAQEATQLDQL